MMITSELFPAGYDWVSPDEIEEFEPGVNGFVFEVLSLHDDYFPSIEQPEQSAEHLPTYQQLLESLKTEEQVQTPGVEDQSGF